MKTVFKSICIALALSFVFSFLTFEQECRAINDDVLRIHILANSDSLRDQELKLKVRDAVLSFTDGLYRNVSNKEEAIEITETHIKDIVKTAEETLRSAGCGDTVSASVLDMDFSTRYYGDITMPSGEYTALRLEIGEAQGKNWWCVMYPSLCLYTCSDSSSMEDEFSSKQYEIVTDKGKYQVKFKILEYFDYFCNLFS